MRHQTKAFFVLGAAVLLFRVNGWAQPAGPGTKPERTTGAITGRVVNSAGEPISGASVTAISLNGARSQTATVNNSGEFKIDGLELGLYRIFTGLTGYVLSPSPAPNDPVYYRVGDSVTLTMTKGAVITGTVKGPNGPLVGIGVFVTRVRDEEGKKLTPAITLRERSTDDRGMFRIYGLQPGSYIVWAARPRVGVVLPSAYDNDAPTYFPSGTRDTATELTVRDGDEVTTDIQYRAEPGHVISGKVVGVFESSLRFSPGASVNLVDLQNRFPLQGTATTSLDNHGFAIYGLPDGEYEIYALQYPQGGDGLRSAPQRVTVRGADVTGLSLTLAPLSSIEGRLVFESDPKAACGQRKETAAPETIVKAWRLAPEKPDANIKPEASTAAPSLVSSPTVTSGDLKGSFLLKNLQSGTYRIDSQPPASGWYLKFIAIGTRTGAVRAAVPNVARDGISLKGGEHITGLVVTITEGASRLVGRISTVEGRSLPPRLAVYLVPVEREAADNVFRFYEARLSADRTFTLDNINPGKYFIVAHSLTENENDPPKSIRQDSGFRATISREAAAAKTEISLKPCERVADYELPFSP